LPTNPNLEKQNNVYHPFGAGATVCLGKHLAQMELRYGVSTFIRDFPEAELSISTTPKSMAMEHYSMIRPVAHRCNITSATS